MNKKIVAFKEWQIGTKATSIRLTALVGRYLEAKAMMKRCNDEAKEILEAIVSEVGEKECEIDGHKLVVRNQAYVSYKEVVAKYLPDVDLEPYKSYSCHWRLMIDRKRTTPKPG